MPQCNEYYPNKEEATTDYDAEFVIFILTTIDNKSSSIASTGVCVLEGSYNRPIFAKMVWNLANVGYFNNTNKIGTESAVEIIIHEIFHALGFMHPMWTYYIDPLTGKNYNYSIVDKNYFQISLPRSVYLA